MNSDVYLSLNLIYKVNITKQIKISINSCKIFMQKC